MQPVTPPPLPQSTRPVTSRRQRVIVTLALIPAVCFGVLIVLRLFGLLIPFSIPTGAMIPAVSTGDHIIMEGFTFLSRSPHRGDIVVFKTDGIIGLPPAENYVKRVVGEPGDHVRITGGKIFINDKQVSLSNCVGEIIYNLPPNAGAASPQTDVTVPSNCYFVLGDNSTRSFDSRFWGCVPRENIIGRASFCTWPLRRVGCVE